jgi:hypothetical protein
MGKRADNIVIISDTVFVLEFKVGADIFQKHSVDQVIDYAVDLKNFHEGSHHVRLVPILISTEATENTISSTCHEDGVLQPYLIGKNEIRKAINSLSSSAATAISPDEWANSIYKPTPTIIEAAQALYEGHNVKEITRNDADAINLSITTNCINQIIDGAKSNNSKSICFVTGVPGAGKTLAGLNIAIERKKINEDEHAVYLSGNGPLVSVLREALARDEVQRANSFGKRI